MQWSATVAFLMEVNAIAALSILNTDGHGATSAWMRIPSKSNSRKFRLPR